MLHIMMVEECRDQDEEERHNWYDFNNNDDEYNNNAPIDPAEEFVEVTGRDRITHSATGFFYDGPAMMLLWRVISSNNFYSIFDHLL